jgi:thioredoxin 1
MITELLSLEQFKNILQNDKINGIANIHLIDFYGENCGPCKNIYPFLNDISKKTRGVTFLKIDVEKSENNSDIADIVSAFDIENLPTIWLLKDGIPVDYYVGSDRQSIIELINNYLS